MLTTIVAVGAVINGIGSLGDAVYCNTYFLGIWPRLHSYCFEKRRVDSSQ